MAQYKVPQDVEADDKLIGPFSFRQFVYLLIAGGLVALAVGLFRIFPLLAIIPLLPTLLFLALALPIKKDQPMETYLAAIVSYYVKPRTRLWVPGQKESTIMITAPKIVEDNRVRDISSEEATHRLSFLADIVDSQGYAIRGTGEGPIKDDLIAEANATVDMFETNHFDNLEDTIVRDEMARHDEVIKEMREAIKANEDITRANTRITKENDSISLKGQNTKSEFSFGSTEPDFNSRAVVQPNSPVVTHVMEKSNTVRRRADNGGLENNPKPSIIELANNTEYSVATIAKEAKRINNRKDEGEVFISLH